MKETPVRAQLIHLDVDRRLGHEWDEWDGRALPNGGNYDAPPRLFVLWALAWTLLTAGLAAVTLFVLAPRIAQAGSALPRLLGLAIAAVAAAGFVWWMLMGLSWIFRVPLLPERLAERGPLLLVMRRIKRVAGLFGQRDRAENAAVKVYNRFARMRGRKVGPGELLLLVPRCLARDVLEDVLEVAGRHEVAVFVATRGQLARRVIRERRPRAVVAVACERDMVSGLSDVAGKVPVLGLTLTLPSGPCKDTRVDVAQLEEFIREYVV